MTNRELLQELLKQESLDSEVALSVFGMDAVEINNVEDDGEGTIVISYVKPA